MRRYWPGAVAHAVSAPSRRHILARQAYSSTPRCNGNPTVLAQHLSACVGYTGSRYRPTALRPRGNGNLTMYFESETTRQTFLDTPVDHPFRLADNPTAEGYDEG